MTTGTFEHTYTHTLKATPDRVFAALTTSAALEAWFAERVEVDLSPGGAFACWGRFTYGTPSRAESTGRVVRVTPDEELAFTWTVDGVESEVTWRVAPHASKPERTTLAVVHRFPRRPEVAHFPALVDDLWRLHCGNLAAWLKGDAPLRIDFGEATPEIRFAIEIDAPAERVFHALTDPEALQRWIAVPAVKVDLRVGGHYDWGWMIGPDGNQVPTGPTTILELVPNERLVTDWPDWRGDPTHPKSRVSWILERVSADRTRVTLVHDHFWRPADLSDYAFGWPGFLENLRKAVEDTGARG